MAKCAERGRLEQRSGGLQVCAVPLLQSALWTINPECTCRPFGEDHMHFYSALTAMAEGFLWRAAPPLGCTVTTTAASAAASASRRLRAHANLKQMPHSGGWACRRAACHYTQAGWWRFMMMLSHSCRQFKVVCHLWQKPLVPSQLPKGHILCTLCS